MKRLLFFLMLIFAFLTVFAGIVESQSWHGDTPRAHITAAVLLIILIIVHIVVQRKAVMCYLTGSAKLPADPRQKRRQIMRRITVYLMLVFGLMTVISASLADESTGLPVFHVVMASIFVLFFVRHLLANRKAIGRYFVAGKSEPVAGISADIEDSAG